MILEKVIFSANDEQDSILLIVGDLKHRFGYIAGFKIDQGLRQAAKQAARLDRVPASFWRELDLPDLDDLPKKHRGYRQSKHRVTYRTWKVGVEGTLVTLTFDNVTAKFSYEDAIKIGATIRVASRRAKRWAGDTSRYRDMTGYLTDAEDDYKLGLA